MLNISDFLEDQISFTTNGVFYPKHQVIETDTNYKIKMIVPGFNTSEVFVKATAEKGEISVSGEISGDRDTTMKGFYRFFQKTFVFEDIDTSTCSANLEDGVLVLNCNKTELTTLEIPVV